MGDLVDRAAALERVGGDLELLQELAQLFLEDSARQLVQMRQAIAQGNGHALQQAAHALKGSVAIFGAPEAVAAAQQLEALGRTEDLGPATESLTALEEHIQRLKPALEALGHKRLA
jgi:HPt (histidine-containing phosphotransfer) domain-containing protein